MLPKPWLQQVFFDDTLPLSPRANRGPGVLCFFPRAGGMIRENLILVSRISKKAGPLTRGRQVRSLVRLTKTIKDPTSFINPEREREDLRWTEKNNSTNILMT